jgi:hypothetical protein
MRQVYGHVCITKKRTKLAGIVRDIYGKPLNEESSYIFDRFCLNDFSTFDSLTQAEKAKCAIQEKETPDSVDIVMLDMLIAQGREDVENFRENGKYVVLQMGDPLFSESHKIINTIWGKTTTKRAANRGPVPCTDFLYNGLTPFRILEDAKYAASELLRQSGGGYDDHPGIHITSFHLDFKLDQPYLF